MRTAGALFNLTVKEERTGVAGKTTSFNSAGRTEQKKRSAFRDPKEKPPGLVSRGVLKHTVEGGMQGEHQGDLQ